MNAAVIGALIALVGIVAPAVRAHSHNRLARAITRREGHGGQPAHARPSAARAIWHRIAGSVARRRQSAALPAQALAAMLDDIARHCASGQSLAAAFVTASAAAPLCDRFCCTNAALRTGATIDEALAREQLGHPDATLAIHVLRLCARQGGSMSESLDRAAATLRERHAANQERVAQAAQARLSAKVLTVVPIAFATWTMLTTESIQQFMTTPVGLACAVTGIGLNLVGWSWMNRAIRGIG